MSPRRVAIVVPALVARLVTLAVAPPVAAQDFAMPAPAAPPARSGALLESGLPPLARGPALSAAFTRWHGLAALTTRATTASIGWRAWRGALGLAQTGEPEVGWTALGMAIGAVHSAAGAGLRAVARRDRTTPFGFDARGAAVGLEVGGGAWLEAAPRLHVWASAPQLWSEGEAPPLARPLELGGTLDLGGIDLWLARGIVAGYPRGSRGEHTAGLATRVGPCRAWIGARDQPLRGSLGVEAQARALRVAAEVQSHPVLGETTRLALALGGGK